MSLLALRPDKSTTEEMLFPKPRVKSLVMEESLLLAVSLPKAVLPCLLRKAAKGTGSGFRKLMWAMHAQCEDKAMLIFLAVFDLSKSIPPLMKSPPETSHGGITKKCKDSVHLEE